MEPQQLIGFAIVSFTLAMTPGADWAYAISAGLRPGRIAPAIAGLCAGYLVHTALIVAGLAAVVAARPELLSILTVLGAGYLLWLGISTIRSWRSAGFTADQDQAASAVSVAAPAPAPAPAGMPALSAGGGAEASVGVGVAAGGGAGAGGGALATLTVPRETESVDSLSAGAPHDGAPHDGALVTRLPDTADRRAFFKGLGTSGTNPKALLLYVALIPQFVAADAAWPVPLQSAALGLSHLVLSAVLYTCVALGARRLLRSRPGAARVVTLCSGIIMVLLALGLVGEQVATLI